MKLTHEDLKQINRYYTQPNANLISGFVKEHISGNVYPFTNVTYRDNKPYDIEIIKDSKVAIIPYEEVSVYKF